MRELRIILAVCLATALLVAALAVPTSAASKGKLAIVQGWLGQKVDVCLSGKEVASGLKFGAVVYRKPAVGGKMVKVYKADPRTCKGTLLAKRWMSVKAGSDKTMVIGKWKKPKRILVFGNEPPAHLVDPFATYMVFRHAADYGAVTFQHVLADLPEAPMAPAVGPTMDWQRGNEAWRAKVYYAGDTTQFATTWVSVYLSYWPVPLDIAGPKLTRIGGHERYEFIFIGRGLKTKLLVLKRK